MVKEYAAVSPDQQKALLANSTTSNVGLETRRVVATNGAIHNTVQGTVNTNNFNPFFSILP